MRIVAISDTHNSHQYLNLPEGDILIHAGDATGLGSEKEIKNFADWFNSQKFTHKIFVPGNHDWGFQLDFAKYEAMFYGVQVLHERAITIEGIKIYGAAWQPEFCNWAFNVPRDKTAVENWAKIPDDTNILITHGPPYGTLDLVHTGRLGVENVGCEALRDRIKSLPQLAVHIFGHIHDCHGHIVKDNVAYVNAAFLNDNYAPAYPPIVIEL